MNVNAHASAGGVNACINLLNGSMVRLMLELLR